MRATALVLACRLAVAAADNTPYELVKEGVECASEDQYLEVLEDEQACANACAAISGCRFFLFGYGDVKAGRCWNEKTTSRNCPEGWENDEYNFYALTDAVSPNPPAPPPKPAPPPPRKPPPSPPSPSPPPLGSQPDYHRERYGAECMSTDTNLGMQPDLDGCAHRCKSTPGCKYFIYGRGFKAGRCFWEHTNSSSCTEGWEVDEYDFYSIRCHDGYNCYRGCTEPRASNYDPSATADDGSCEGLSGCVCVDDKGKQCACGQSPECQGTCTSCDKEERTGSCKDGKPYRSKEFDLVEASKVNDASITIDGDLSDWAAHMGDRCYKDVPFAKLDGTEVLFETADGGTGKASDQGGKYFGPSDFSIKWMLSWDSDYLYLAATVTDDVLQTSSVCYENGLQVAFEVGGPGRGEMAGVLQHERSADLDVSRLQLINMALGADQHACSTEGGDARMCCVQYELSHQVENFFRRAKLAVLRNPMSRTTTYEAAFHKTDLLGGSQEHLKHWGDGLTFGFSFVINDGDDVAKQNGWAGYYPHAIVRGWNGGQKEPQKAGTVRLGSTNHPSEELCGSGGGGGGGGGGGFWWGAVVTVLVLLGCGFFTSWREGGVDSAKGYPWLLVARMRACCAPSSDGGPRARTGASNLASSDYAGYNASYNAPTLSQPSFVTGGA